MKSDILREAAKRKQRKQYVRIRKIYFSFHAFWGLQHEKQLIVFWLMDDYLENSILYTLINVLCLNEYAARANIFFPQIKEKR